MGNFPRCALDHVIERRGENDLLCLRIGRPLDEFRRVLAIHRRLVHRQALHQLDLAKSSIRQNFLPLELHFDVLLAHEVWGKLDPGKLLVLLVEIQLGKDSFPGLVELRDLLTGHSAARRARGRAASGLRLNGVIVIEDRLIAAISVFLVVGVVGLIVGQGQKDSGGIFRLRGQRSTGENGDISGYDNFGEIIHNPLWSRLLRGGSKVG